ncbi:unnamed protein product [Rhizoctonia solani]|uniref:F-box domain-containing protein n=1 Tax=Rhizoctonia solani TaxID=456999 RepID=A0A8H3E5T6_9AGAM|nr:unnamed protein product [Rhizoctonia solani]
MLAIGSARSTDLRRVATSTAEMPKARKPQNATSSVLLKWENAGKKLASALSDYLQSCISLETLSATQYVDHSDTLNHIENSLETLHPKLSSEFSQSQVILARIHNKMSSRFHLLPNEILAEIFVDVVYNPRPDESRFPRMVDDIQRIAGRLHCLLAVCSTWRNAVLELGELWTVIPITDVQWGRCPLKASSLALQRSQARITGDHQLHLAAVLFDSCNPDKLLENNTLPPFTGINIQGQSKDATTSVFKLFRKLIGSQALSLVSEISIHQYHGSQELYSLKSLRTEDYLESRLSKEEVTTFRRLMKSLTTLRLRNVNIHWRSITFSSQLVDLHLQSLVLDDFVVDRFLGALQSAPEIRNLKIISVIFLPSGLESTRPKPKIKLPKLKSLLLADLYFNILDYILVSIARGSYRTQLAMTYKSWSTLHDRLGDFDEDPDSLPDPRMGFYEDEADYNHIVEMLKYSNIDTLILNQDICEMQSDDPTTLPMILSSVPDLRSLVFKGWDWSLGDLQSLKRPNLDQPFPRLTELYILDGCIKGAHRLPRIAASHSLQTLVVDSADSLIPKDGDRKAIIRRLKRAVPDFRFVGGSEQVDELNYELWRIW